ncbi:hypothetical protein HMPREF1326_00724 [Akkermansia sp. KLE1605]|nr:hypothetical protein HMPREF1326_00724 [Akkermansia sp. KLE1605]
MPLTRLPGLGRFSLTGVFPSFRVVRKQRHVPFASLWRAILRMKAGNFNCRRMVPRVCGKAIFPPYSFITGMRWVLEAFVPESGVSGRETLYWRQGEKSSFLRLS